MIIFGIFFGKHMGPKGAGWKRKKRSHLGGKLLFSKLNMSLHHALKILKCLYNCLVRECFALKI